jgi:hypothetical protein
VACAAPWQLMVAQVSKLYHWSPAIECNAPVHVVLLWRGRSVGHGAARVLRSGGRAWLVGLVGRLGLVMDF